jgi:phage tail sheath protein FI
VTDEVPRYIGIDPGDTSGWAKADVNGIMLNYGQYKLAEQNKWLADNITPDILEVVIEDYRNYRSGTFRGQTNQTSKNIGAIEMICELRNVPYVLQPANVKKIGYKFAGLGQAPSNHSISHQFDAVAHLTYRLRITGILIPKEH